METQMFHPGRKIQARTKLFCFVHFAIHKMRLGRAEILYSWIIKT